MLSRLHDRLSVFYYIPRHGCYPGWCPICEKKTIFYKRGNWLRDDLRCIRCESIPRWRAFIHVLNSTFPDWRNLAIHESSPGGASSSKIQKECRNYIPTYFFPDTPVGHMKNGIRCENLEELTFDDESFDMVITQDVFEHILSPARAFSEIARTLKPGGSHVFTVPWLKTGSTVTRAVLKEGNLCHLQPPKYHGNPVDAAGSLVVTDWGDDLIDFIKQSSGMDTLVTDILDRRMGIDGELREVFISTKGMESHRETGSFGKPS